MKYAWTGWPRAIEANRDSYSVTMMCDLLSVSRSGLHDAHGRKPSLRTVANTQIVKRMQCAQRKHRGCYGRRRMTPEMSEVLGRPVNQKRIGRLMRAHDLNSRKRRKFRVVTTDSKHAHPVAANVLERNFVADVPNQKWLADLTYVPTDEGWLFVALVLDLFARKIVGWAMSDTMPQELTLAALWVALGWRDPDPGLVHHSDRGSQYAANDYRAVLKARGIMVSMSRKGDCWEREACPRGIMRRWNRLTAPSRSSASMTSTSRLVPRPSGSSLSTLATTIPNVAIRHWETFHRLNSSGVGMLT